MQELDLPSILSNDIIVTISVILTESNHYPSDVQVVATQTEEGEQPQHISYTNTDCIYSSMFCCWN